MYGFAAALYALISVHIVVDGKEVTIERGRQPVIIDGRVFAAVCTISKPLGAEIFIHEPDEFISIDRGPIKMVLPLGTRTVKVSGEEREMELPARRIGQPAYYPLRFVVEQLGGTIAWDPAKRTVLIVTKPVQPN
jgi:hypothetical protein